MGCDSYVSVVYYGCVYGLLDLTGGFASKILVAESAIALDG